MLERYIVFRMIYFKRKPFCTVMCHSRNYFKRNITEYFYLDYVSLLLLEIFENKRFLVSVFARLLIFCLMGCEQRPRSQ